MAQNPKQKSSLAAQEFLAIDSVRDGVILLKNREGLRSVLIVSALNFALKSDQEQDATIAQYENLLNSLDFPLEFVIQSRHLNINPYLDTLREREKEETSELLKVQIGEYIEFVKTFVELSNIVSKSFFVVVPFTPSMAERQTGIFSGLAALWGGVTSKPKTPSGESDEELNAFRGQLQQRVDTVSLGLRRMGLRAVQLNTEELIELFYGLYNPTESQKVTETAPKT